MEENTTAMKEIQSVLDDLAAKASNGNEDNGDAPANRKRVAPISQSSPLKKKSAGAALLVTGFTVSILILLLYPLNVSVER